jgi:hypothetical protein
MRPTVNGRDTVLTDFMSGRAKMVVWYDSARCASCAISKMYLWADILTYAAQIERKFGVVFLFTPKPDDLHAVRIALMSYKIDYPVFLADQTEFVKLNACLPQDDRMHTFLLDADNKVLLVGNPLRNDKLWKLYEATIRKLLINNGRLSASEG